MTHSSWRAGFALPEVLLAVLLFAVGILALAGTATAILSQAEDARALADASALAGSALDSLRASPCATLVDGGDARGRAQVRWTAAHGTRTVAVRATLSLSAPRGARQWTVDALLPCER